MRLKNAWRDVRLQRGLTQEQLAKKIGKTKDAVSKIERSKRGATDDTVAKALVALNCSIQDLYPGVERDEEPEHAAA